MKRKRRQHSPEFKAQAVALIAQGTQTLAAVARELDVAESVLRTWIQKAEGKSYTPPGQTQMMISPAVIEALSPSAIAKFHAGKPKSMASTSRDPAELMVLLDLKPADLKPLQRIKMLANRTGMSTEDLVNELLDLAVVEGIRRKEG